MVARPAGAAEADGPGGHRSAGAAVRDRYASGREGDSHLVALASNKSGISLYVDCVADGAYLAESYRERLPKASVGRSCVRFRRTEDVDLHTLRELVAAAARIGPPVSGS